MLVSIMIVDGFRLTVFLASSQMIHSVSPEVSSTERELLTLQPGSTGDMCQTVLAAQGLDYSQLREKTQSAR